MGLGALRFWAAEHLPRPPLCQQATSIQCVKYGNTYTDKSVCWHTGGGGGVITSKLRGPPHFSYTPPVIDVAKQCCTPNILVNAASHRPSTDNVFSADGADRWFF